MAGVTSRRRRARLAAAVTVLVVILVVAGLLVVRLVRGGSGGSGGGGEDPAFATNDQIASLSTSSGAAKRAEAVANDVRDGTYVGGSDSSQTTDIKNVENRVGSIALTTALWWKRTGDDSYLGPLKKFILDSPKNYDPAVQSLFEMRAYGGLFAAVNILSASGEWSSTARLPHYDDVTWDEFMNGGGDSFKKKLPMRTLSGVGRQQWRTIRGASVDSASNWGGVARFAYLMWAVCEKDRAAIEENAQLLRKWLGSTGTGEADFNTTAAYRSSWNNWADPGAPDGSRQKLVSGVGKSDPDQPGLDGVVIEDVARGDTGYDARGEHFGATGQGLTYPLENADAVWASAGVLANLGYHPRSWGQGGDALTRLAGWLDRVAPDGDQSVFESTQAEFSIYRNHPWLAQRFSSRPLHHREPTESGPAGLDRLTTFGDWIAAPSSSWAKEG